MVSIISSILLFIALCGMTGTVGWILRRGNNNKMTRLFIVCQLSIALWIISQLLILLSESKKQLWISYLIGNMGICCFSPFWLMFSAEYSETGGLIKKIIGFMPLLSVIMFICIAFNPVHNLYYTVFEKRHIEYGILFYIFQLWFYVFIIWGIVMIIRNKKNRQSHTLLVLATAVPLIVNIFTVTGIIKSEIEITPLFFAFSVIMILIAIRRFGLLNINRIAIHDTIYNISTAVIVFDADDNMTYRNKYADKIFNFDDIETFSDFMQKTGINQGDIEISGEYYNIRQSMCINKKNTEIAKVIIINNVSEYYELAKTEKKLSLEQERNRIAQEIHDSAGHTFTMISSLAKILRVETDKVKISEYIEEIDGLSRSGITQLRCSINNLRDDEFMSSVTKAIKTVTTAVRNIKVELYIQGVEDESFSFCVKEVYDSTRETLTNAMCYSKADRIDIIVKFLSDRLELYIFDNGCGCSEIKENNGLSGIRRRTEMHGGSVKFSSVDGEGFTTIIKI
ncbi:MAG: two-component sensor histidine kinase, partial [Ruminococcus sp.]|nr:two-component sensor histidine kinase [Ruminococcus sp.]